MENKDLLLKALSVALGKDKVISNIKLPVGNHNIDGTVTFHIKGMVQQLQDTERTPTTSIPLLDVLARVISKTGWAGPQVIKTVMEATTEAIKEGKTVGEYMDFTNEAMVKVKEALAKLPKTPVSGQLKTILEVNVVEKG